MDSWIWNEKEPPHFARRSIPWPWKNKKSVVRINEELIKTILEHGGDVEFLQHLLHLFQDLPRSLWLS